MKSYIYIKNQYAIINHKLRQKNEVDNLILIIFIRQNQMKTYSFSNIAAQDTYLARKSNDLPNNYRHTQIKSNQSLQRIQEIKKKYDTPSRRQRIQSLKKSKQFQMGIRSNQRDQLKQNLYQYPQRASNYTPNYLKQSFAVNRLQKNSLKGDLDNKQFINLRNNQMKRSYGYEDNEFNSIKAITREQQELVMSKMRQIKQTAIHKDYMRGSIQGKNNFISKGTKQQNKTYDSRVDNIDKINTKIKQILSYFNQNDYKADPKPNSSVYQQNNKQSGFFGQKGKQLQNKRPYENHNHKNSDVIQKINMCQNKTNSFQNKSIYPIKNSVDKSFQNIKSFQKSQSRYNFQVPRRQNNYLISKDKQPSSYQKSDYSINSKLTYKRQELARTPDQVAKVGDAKSCLRQSRSRSYIDSMKKSTLIANNTTENNNILKSGKKLNEELQKMQNKIEELERQKRKLNIEFTPFSMKNRSNSNLLAHKYTKPNEQNRQNQLQKVQKKQLLRDVSKTLIHNKSNFEYKFKQYQYKQPDNKNIQNKRQSNYQTSFFYTKNAESDHFQSRKKSIQEDKNIQDTVRINNSINVTEQASINNYKYDQGIQKRTNDGMIQRKKKLQSSTQAKSEKLKQFVSLFCEQAKLDQSFRNMKIWLQGVFESNKFQKISSLLQKQKYNISIQQCKQRFQVYESQHNPFFTSQGLDGSYEALVKAFLKSQQNWKNKIKNKFNKNELQEMRFPEKINLQQKGFIQLQDFVRFLNIESGIFLRNRDIFLIFHRLTKDEKASYDEIIKNICY